MNLKFTLLAMLSAGPRTGDELTRAFDCTAGFVWHAPHSQIYPELRRMEADEQLGASEIRRGTRATKRRYHINDIGLEELHRQADDVTALERERDPVRLKAVYLEFARPEAALAQFESHIAFYEHWHGLWSAMSATIRALHARDEPVLQARLAIMPADQHDATVAWKVFSCEGLVARARVEIEWTRRGSRRSICSRAPARPSRRPNSKSRKAGMAELVAGIGMSHSSLIATDDPSVWLAHEAIDRDNHGRSMTFDELEQADGRSHAAQAERSPHRVVRWCRPAPRCNVSENAVAEHRIDVLVVFGDDQEELHDLDNMPALAVYCGEDPHGDGHALRTYEAELGDVSSMMREYAMDAPHVSLGHERLARHLIASLLDAAFDVGAIDGVAPGGDLGVGHAFGIMEMKLAEPGSIALVPVFVYKYWPPNQLPVSRCYDLGRAVRAAIDVFPEDVRVAVVASGGLSHPADVQWLAPRLAPHPFETYPHPARVTPRSLEIPATFVECVDWMRLFEPFAQVAAGRGWPMRQITTGHEAMVTAPEALSTVLDETATQA